MGFLVFSICNVFSLAAYFCAAHILGTYIHRGWLIGDSTVFCIQDINHFYCIAFPVSGVTDERKYKAVYIRWVSRPGVLLTLPPWHLSGVINGASGDKNESSGLVNGWSSYRQSSLVWLFWMTTVDICRPSALDTGPLVLFLVMVTAPQIGFKSIYFCTGCAHHAKRPKDPVTLVAGQNLASPLRNESNFINHEKITLQLSFDNAFPKLVMIRKSSWKRFAGRGCLESNFLRTKNCEK